MIDVRTSQVRGGMMVGTVASLPEQGNLVGVRSRRWVVGELAKITLPPPPLGPISTKPQHLVSLLTVEDDALGEMLEVVWDIEPGAEVIAEVDLREPTGLEPPHLLDAPALMAAWIAPLPGPSRFFRGVTIPVLLPSL